MELWQRFTSRARRAVLMAHDEAARMGAQLISTEHLLLGLMRLGEGTASELLDRLGLDLERLRTDLRRQMEATAPGETSKDISFTPEAQRVLTRAYQEAKQLGDYHIGTEHILIGLLREGRGAAFRLLRRHGAELSLVRQALSEIQGRNAPQREPQEKRGKTPTLDHFSRDLTQMARDGQLDPVIGRDEEAERVIQILCRRTKNNPCLIGEAGVGKTAIVEGLAQRVADSDVPDLLRDKRVVALDLASLVAGTKYRGEFEERMKRIMEELRNCQGEVIVFLDELHTIVGTGAAEGAMDASNMLKPALARGEMQCIGATTLDEFRKHIEKTPSLERRFQPVMVKEPDREQTLDILQGIKDRYEEYHGVAFTEEAIEASVDLSTRYIADRMLPDKAIDLLDEAGSRVKLREYKQVCREDRIDHGDAGEDTPNPLPHQFDDIDDLDDEEPLGAQQCLTDDEWTPEPRVTPVVERDDIAQIVATWTGIPVVSLTEAESRRLLRMEDALHEDIVSQDEAIRTIARAVRRSRAGIKDPNRPTGSFIFLGPTGVGKTYLARMLAKFLFGNEDALIRIDMSEYMEKFAVSRLIGAPPGYVGYEESGQLSEAVRRRPYSIVLFDEIEKAHPEVFSILLQIMEDGRLTDAQGRVVDFKKTIVIMTSNVGARLITTGNSVGFTTDKAEDTAREHRRDYSRMKSKVMEELKKTFSPEFLNRVDDTVVFHALTPEEIGAIVDLEVGKVSKQLQNRGLDLHISEPVHTLLAEEGYDPAMGARPLRRAVRRLIEDPLSEYLLELGEDLSGEIEVELDDLGEPTFHLEETSVTATN
ncbi:MAG: ATP-dependent Clp protease ATP-binding subunit [Armatimonadia bacterium]